MRILFVTNTYYPHVNGVYSFIQQLCTNLKNGGHRVAIIAPSSSLQESHFDMNGIEFFGLPSLPVFFYKNIRIPIGILLKDRMISIIDSFEPDIIHLQDHFLLSKIAVQLTGASKIPVIATNHFMPENLTCYLPFKGLKKYAERWMWKGFSKIFNEVQLVTTPTETAANLIASKLKVPVQVISNGIDAVKFFPSDKVNDIKTRYGIADRPMLLYVGRVDPEKHINEVLEAMTIVVKQRDCSLVVCGTGVAKKKLEQMAEQLGIAKNVVFTGFVPDEDLPLMYKAADCFITASIAELQSIATLEAMASGLPVIAVNAGALSELVHDGENGYLFKSGNVHQLAAAIVSFFGAPYETKQAMADASLQRAAGHGIQKTVSAYERLYRKYGYQSGAVIYQYNRSGIKFIS